MPEEMLVQIGSDCASTATGMATGLYGSWSEVSSSRSIETPSTAGRDRPDRR